MDLRRILESPAIYQKFQEFGGFFGARLKSMKAYLPQLPSGATVFDIGCGPGHIVEHLPKGVNYHGFDIEPGYIDFARRNFGKLGTFHLRQFDASAAKEFGRANLIMMNALLHHLSDEQATALLRTVHDSLVEGGSTYTLDGCLREGQHPVARWMHTHDRGEFVRDENGYRRLLESAFQRVNIHIREDLSWVPHTYCVTVATLGPLETN
jgi:SAM-dependent methyltransferase